MAKLLKLRRGTTTQHASFTGAEGELTIDTTKDTAVVHDGSTQAGKPLLREDLSNLPAGQIDNADINASAAIAGTKINPSFGSQTISTSGNIVANNGNLQGGVLDVGTADTSSGHINAKEAMTFNIDSDNDDTNRSFKWYKDGSNGSGTQLLALDENGTLTASGNVDCNAGIDVTGEVIATGRGTFNAITITDSQPGLIFNDTTANPDFILQNRDGSFAIRDITNANNRFLVNSANGDVTVTGDVNATGDISGANINATTDIKTTGGGFYLDTAGQITEVSSAPSGAESPDGSVEMLSTGVGKDLLFRSYGDVVFGSSNNTTHTVMKLQMSRLGASVHGKCILNYVTANAGGNTSSATKLETSSTGVSVTGALVASGNVTAFSDAKLKTDIHTINDALGIVGKLRGVSYKWLSNGESDIGVIAQEVEAVVPEVVKETEDGIKTVDYGRLVGVLINAVNELKAEVEELKNAKITE